VVLSTCELTSRIASKLTRQTLMFPRSLLPLYGGVIGTILVIPAMPKRVTTVAFPSVSPCAEHSSEPVNRHNPSIQFSLPLNRRPAATNGLRLYGKPATAVKTAAFRLDSVRFPLFVYELNKLLYAAAARRMPLFSAARLTKKSPAQLTDYVVNISPRSWSRHHGS